MVTSSPEPPLRTSLFALILVACAGGTGGDKGEDGTQGGTGVDADGDGWTAAEDCDDQDPAVNPGAADLCDGFDNDCDGEIDEDLSATWYTDQDDDGYGDEDTAETTCDPAADQVQRGGDCDDAEAGTHPDASELCDGIDNDCDDQIDEDGPLSWYPDADEDGYGDVEAEPIVDCAEVEGHVTNDEDCDDADPDSFPGALEICDELDNDCDGVADDGASTVWYLDNDGDGYGDGTSLEESCWQPSGTAEVEGDCNDSDPAINPDADEHCDGADDDCNGTIDDSPVDAPSWNVDADGDGYGDPDSLTVACDQPTGTVEDDQDCDDSSSDIHPGATEICDLADNDCDGLTDEDDPDLDWSTATTWYTDGDADGYGDGANSSCVVPSGAATVDGDCDDADAAVNPGASEVCNSIDDDCDSLVDDDDSSLDLSTATTWYTDTDGDGYGDATSTVEACAQPVDTTSDDSDCEDGDAAIHPGATEICDGQDNDCDGLTDDDDPALDTSTWSSWYPDSDGDGYGDASGLVESCAAPSGYGTDDADCDDADSAINPDADELCDGVDNDCNALVDDDDSGLSDPSAASWWPDADLDGYGDADGITVTACLQPSGYEGNEEDCDDADVDINPDGTETCNGLDDDCDGTADSTSVCACEVEYDSDPLRPYLFCDSAMTWADAKLSCESVDYHLAFSDDATENTWLTDTALGGSAGYWWFGYSDIAKEGKWLWTDGTAASYTNWSSLDPSNTGKNDDCGLLLFYGDDTWSDATCSDTNYFICEAD